ncbi:hypothetical protein BJY52DRAFT_457212 [Lactarius psammicola]|nr:hypothetical protein BJY52DRAFT_457212 [Lactarius psammicola]
MHSYETLALLALVASTASPALSAPVLEGQHQARADVEERASAIPGGLGDLVKTVGTGLAFGALPAVLGNVLGGGNSTRRDAEVINGPARGLPVISVPSTSTDITFDKPPTPPGDVDKRNPDDFPFPLIGGVFPDGVKSNTVPGTFRRDPQFIDGLNNFETTDAIGNKLKFGIISRRDVAIDNFLSGFQNVGDFIKNVLPRSDSEATRRDVAIDNFLSSFQDVGNFLEDVLPRSDSETTRRDPQFIDGLNNFETTDAIGNKLKFGIISGRDVAIDNFLSDFQSVGDFIKNVLPRSDSETTRREPSPLDLAGIGKTVAGTLASLAAADGVKELLTRGDASSRDLIEALQLISRQLDELD